MDALQGHVRAPKGPARGDPMVMGRTLLLLLGFPAW